MGGGEVMANYFVSGVIAIVCYESSVLIGAVINVLVSSTAGYSSFNDLLENLSISNLLLILLISFFNHLFFSWLTANAIRAYGLKNGCLSLTIYAVAMIAVLITALFINPMLLSKRAGWLSNIVHPIMLFLLGCRFIRKEKDKKAGQRTKDTVSANNVGEKQEVSSIIYEETCHQKYIFCQRCGSKLPSNSEYCSNCGAKLPIWGGK